MDKHRKRRSNQKQAADSFFGESSHGRDNYDYLDDDFDQSKVRAKIAEITGQRNKRHASLSGGRREAD